MSNPLAFILLGAGLGYLAAQVINVFSLMKTRKNNWDRIIQYDLGPRRWWEFWK